jgi:hypothetical protein
MGRKRAGCKERCSAGRVAHRKFETFAFCFLKARRIGGSFEISVFSIKALFTIDRARGAMLHSAA